ncbi:MAG: response regulator [Proteobacteria bacterium]|nr:response regulator [Pseudomonadota bacterium]
MANSGAVVYVVDDDEGVRSALKFALEVEGLDVRLYEGSKALLAEQDLPLRACLVIDYRMPEMDGLELVHALRMRNTNLPVIMITGRVNRDLHRRVEKLGVRCLLEKPLSDSQLVACVRSALADR